MTMEEYNAATDILKKIPALDASIEYIGGLTLRDTAGWIMEIRPNNSYPPVIINHKGLLPEFLDAVLAKLREERAELNKELDKL